MSAHWWSPSAVRGLYRLAMDVLTAGADIATMVTALTVVTALYVWGRNQWNGWQQQKAAIACTTRHGYIVIESVDTRYVRLAEDPDSPSRRVVLEVLNGKSGDPDLMLAHGVRQVIIRDGILSRSPTPEEFEFLKAQRKERGYGKGVPVR